MPDMDTLDQCSHCGAYPTTSDCCVCPECGFIGNDCTCTNPTDQGDIRP